MKWLFFFLLYTSLLFVLSGARFAMPRPAPLPAIQRWRRRMWAAPVGRRVYFVGYMQVM